jgi:hypothetical protein
MLTTVHHKHHRILCPSSCTALNIFASSCRFLMSHDITDLKPSKKKTHPFLEKYVNITRNFHRQYYQGHDKHCDRKQAQS